MNIRSDSRRHSADDYHAEQHDQFHGTLDNDLNTNSNAEFRSHPSNIDHYILQNGQQSCAPRMSRPQARCCSRSNSKISPFRSIASRISAPSIDYVALGNSHTSSNYRSTGMGRRGRAIHKGRERCRSATTAKILNVRNRQPNKETPTSAISPPSEFECSICKDSLVQKRSINLKQCGHLFCIDCLAEWIYNNANDGRNTTCPMCRAELITHSRWEKELLPVKKAYKKAHQNLIYRLLGSSPPVEAIPARHFKTISLMQDFSTSGTRSELWTSDSFSVQDIAGKGLFPVSLVDLKHQLYGRQLTIKKYYTNREFHPIPTLISVALEDGYFSRNKSDRFAAADWYHFLLESIEDAYERVSRDTQFLIQDYMGYLLVSAGLADQMRLGDRNWSLDKESLLKEWLEYHRQRKLSMLKEAGLKSKLRTVFMDGTLDGENTTIHIIWSKEL